MSALSMHYANGFFMNWTAQLKGEGVEYHLLALGLALIVIIYAACKTSLDRLIALRAGSE